MDEAKLGQKVMLKSGGPEMVVVDIIGDSDRSSKIDEVLKMKGYDDGDVFCEWLVDPNVNKRKRHGFRVCMLESLEEIEEEPEPEMDDFDLEDEDDDDDFDF